MTLEAKALKLDRAPSYRWWVLLMNLLIYSVYYISLNAAAAFAVQIQDGWNASATMLNMLTTVAQLVYVVFCAIGASLATRLGDKRTVIVSGVLLLVASGLFPLVGVSYEGAMVLRVLQGAAGGIMSSCVIATTSLWFPLKQRGLASGILFGCIGLGFSITVAGGNLFLSFGFDWQASLALLVCIPCLIVTVLYAVTVKNVSDVYPGVYAIAEIMDEGESVSQPEAEAVQKDLPSTMAQARKNKRVIALSFTGFVNSWLILGFSAFLPFLLTGDLHVEGGFVATVMSLTFIAGVAGSILGGIISDKVFRGLRWQTLVLSGLLVGVGLLLLLAVRGELLVVCMLMLAYLGANMYMGPLWACVPSLVRPKIAGETTALVNTVTNLGGLSVGPLLGLLIDATGTAVPALVVCVVLAVASCVAARIVHV